MNIRNKVALTGLFSVVFVITLVMGIAFFAGWQVSKEGFRISVQFNFLGNLVKNAPVLVAGGIKVGFVEEIYQKDLQTYLTLYLKSELKDKIPRNKDTQVSVFTNNMLGQKYISLVIGTPRPGDTFLKENDVIRGIDPPSLDQMLLSFSGFFGSTDTEEILTNILTDLKTLNTNIAIVVSENRDDVQKILEYTSSSFGPIQKQFLSLQKELSAIETNFSQASDTASMNAIVKNFGTVTKDLSELKGILKTGHGSMLKLLSDKKLRRNTRVASKNAQDFLRCVNERPWVLIYKQSCL